MAHARGGDFMFCDLCGTMMFLYSKEHVECPLCKFKKSAKDLSEREISYQVSSEDMRRDLGISHFEGKMEVKDMEMLELSRLTYIELSSVVCSLSNWVCMNVVTAMAVNLITEIVVLNALHPLFQRHSSSYPASQQGNLGNTCGGIYNEGLVGSITCAVNSLDLGFRVV
ncbi:hypothetical protein D5086_024059 [Populus alba]|uniref:Uncharacterized protein n=1 Tax=Populus alba TaxID=43335 RepID=A0ACC4B532_POPAL